MMDVPPGTPAGEHLRAYRGLRASVNLRSEAVTIGMRRCTAMPASARDRQVFERSVKACKTARIQQSRRATPMRAGTEGGPAVSYLRIRRDDVEIVVLADG